MVRKQKLLGQINKVRTLAEGVGRFQEANGNLFHIIDGQWVSGQKLLTFLFFRVKRVTQLALQELNLISQFNFNLVLPDIIANKTPGESALPGKFVFQSYVSKPFASTPCLGDLVFCFSILLMVCFFVYVITWDK